MKKRQGRKASTHRPGWGVTSEVADLSLPFPVPANTLPYISSQTPTLGLFVQINRGVHPTAPGYMWPRRAMNVAWSKMINLPETHEAL